MDALPAAIAERMGDIRALCEKYYVQRLTLFGSAAKGTFNPEKSDLDFVVDFDEDPTDTHYPWGGRLIALLGDLQDLFGRKVDVVERCSIENPYFVQVLALTERPVYERTRAA
ncbi:MAG TPA: nucleotidyltransferase domain-containing protein [Thermoanaerobaculia bacterium]|nr:nucleotidyltransferase domain-containing protein [Thermoanaerobaculia bacterium]